MSTYRVQVIRVAGRIEVDVHDCESTDEAIKLAINALLIYPAETKEKFDRAQLNAAGESVVELMERDVRVVM